MSALRVPVMFQGAAGDVFVTPFVYSERRPGAFAQAPRPKYHLELPGGTHFEWTNFICAGIADAGQCAAQRQNARRIVGYTVAFFDAYLKGDRTVLDRLRGEGLAVWKAEP
jgi:hypothetical protein